MSQTEPNTKNTSDGSSGVDALLREAMELLNEVRTGEDFEVQCGEHAGKIEVYLSSRKGRMQQLDIEQLVEVLKSCYDNAEHILKTQCDNKHEISKQNAQDIQRMIIEVLSPAGIKPPR